MAEDFELDLVEGELLIRDADEATALANPTKVTGSLDTGDGGTGAITDGAFSTPPISFQTVDPGTGFDVFVDASFSQAGPATGSIDSAGNVHLVSNLNVDLHIEVQQPPILTAECEAGPINLVLDSTAPWDPETKRVTVADADFTVPATSETPTCIDIIADGVNNQLAGSGHRLEMTLEGDLTLPPAPGCPTITEIEAAPAGQSRLGDEVALTSTTEIDPDFADDEECEDVEPSDIPSGLVEFKAGPTLLGTTEADGTGTAMLTTDDIPAGTFDLTARYRGDDAFSPSTSPATSYKVAAPVSISADLPDSVLIGGGLSEFEVTLTNTGLGADVVNGRLQINVRGTSYVPLHVDLEYWNGNAWVPVTAQGGQDSVFATLSPDTGFPLLAGQEVVRKVRLGLGNNPILAFPPPPQLLDVIFEVVEVDPTTGLPAAGLAPSENAVGSAASTLRPVNATRTPVTLSPGFPVVFPHTLRQGQTVRVNFSNSQAAADGDAPGGHYTVLLDGRPVPARESSTPPALGLQPTVAAFDGNGAPINNLEFPIPEDAATGSRTVTVKYSGDVNFEPAQMTEAVYVLTSRGDGTFACSSQFLSSDLFYVNVVAHANLGTVRPSGGTVALNQLDVKMYLDRGDAAGSFGLFFTQGSNPVIPPGSGAPFSVSLNGLGMGFGELGDGTATSLNVANNFPMFGGTPPDPDPDMVFDLEGESASVIVTGEPGDVVPVNLDSIQVLASFATATDPLAVTLNCVPAGDPLTLGSVTIAGTTLTVDAPAPTREGDAVTLTAKVAPAGTTGTVELRDGTDSLTVVPVRSDGTASFTTEDLGAGVHQLSARFFGGLAANSTTSAAVSLTVLPEFDCPAFTEEGNGAVVRLVYLELLGRCPDQAGYDHWVGRLDAGTTPEAFARTIARTSEAVGQVVDDAYDTMLGRAPDAEGRTFWIGRLQASGRYDQLLADLAGSAEFWTLSGSSNAGFVTRVYEQLLGRAPEPAGLDYWVGRLDTGTSRKVLVRSLANLDEPLGRLVAASYDEILGRTPFNTERSDGVEYLRETGNRSGLYAQLIGTGEFDDRAQDFPNPED